MPFFHQGIQDGPRPHFDIDGLSAQVHGDPGMVNGLGRTRRMTAIRSRREILLADMVLAYIFRLEGLLNGVDEIARAADEKQVVLARAGMALKQVLDVAGTNPPAQSAPFRFLASAKQRLEPAITVGSGQSRQSISGLFPDLAHSR